jgi:GWxTD domain-containing protein
LKTAYAATFLLLVSGSSLSARDSKWLDAVSPVMTSAEKKIYLSLQPEAQQSFQDNFWAGKSITAEEYYRRLEYVDSNYGSTKMASGANTDPGRIYLSLGAPDRVTRIPSSRVFSPLEIWYYNTVPALPLNTELRLIFYQKNSLGLPKLYSPTLDTIRALLLPQSSTISMFGPNDELTESDIRKNLSVGPAEDEVISAAVGVASGIKHTGNDELLGRIASPEFMLRKQQQTDVESRFIVSRPRLEMLQSTSSYGGRQVDFVLNTKARREIKLQVLDGAVTIYQNQVHLKFQQAERMQYTHRLDLLPGSYSVVFSLDGKAFPYALMIPEQPALGEIVRVNANADSGRNEKPLVFGGRSFSLSDTGQTAFVTLPAPGEVTWTVRRDMQVISKSRSMSSTVAWFDLPKHLDPGSYSLEATYGHDARTTQFVAAKSLDSSDEATHLSFNANLQPALRWSFLGHQWLLKNNLVAARQCLEASLKLGVTKEAEVELARAEALAGEWDAARNRVSRVLAARPNDFDALTVLAYIETKLQDYTVAADLYRRALAVQDSPALRTALASLPTPSMAN